MKLSIITINYNDKAGLKKTIESVITQTFTDYEYIIIDGGSTDGSVEIIKQYQDKITYWVSEPDNGVYNAMNKGIVKAKGEYLQFLNSGDWLVNNEVLANIFKNLPDCDMVYGNAVILDGEKYRVAKTIQGTHFKLSDFFTSTINHQSSFINKRLFNKYGLYDERYKIVSDWKFYVQAFGLNFANVIYKNIPVSHFDTNGISHKLIDLRNQEMALVKKEIIPPPILLDYQKFRPIETKMININRYNFTKQLYKLSEFILLNISRIISKLRLIING